MLISLLLIVTVTLGGMSLTYLVAEEKPLMWRLAAGNIVGSAVFGTLLLLVANLAGLTLATTIACLALSLAPLAVFLRPEDRGEIKHDWAVAKGKLQGSGAKRFRAFAYYTFFFLLFWFFFKQAMYELPDGIFTGGSQNLGDLPFHLGAIASFTDGANFPPQNPSFAGTKFSYPFVSDLITAAFVRLGAGVADAMVLQDISWAMSLLVILERFTTKVTGSRLAGRIAPALLFFSGGLGFYYFAKDWLEAGTGFWNFLWHLPRDYTIGELRWGNSLLVLFLTQRSLLLGMPLTIMVLHGLWKIFQSEKVETEKGEKVEQPQASNLLPFSFFPFSTFALGLLAGTLPLIHLHSLFALFTVTAFLFLFRPKLWRYWCVFGVAVAAVAVPELIWSTSGTATDASKFFALNWGWDKGPEEPFLWFWFKNVGLAIPLIIAGGWLFYARQTTTEGTKEKRREAHTSLVTRHSLIFFYLPFLFLFVLCNVMKFAPWEWDNIKILIYWFVGSTPLMAYAIAWAWEGKTALKVGAVACFIVLTLSGFLDVWRTATGQVKIKVIDRDGVELAERIKRTTDPHALFLNAPTYNSPVLLSGRLSLMRYSGHLSSYGIDYQPREDDVRKIYLGGGVAEVLLRKYNIDHILIGPEERDKLQANEEYFRKFPLTAQSGQYRVYKVK